MGSRLPKHLLGGPCRRCGEPIIYAAASKKPAAAECPDCWRAAIATEDFAFSIRVAFVVSELDLAMRRLSRQRNPAIIRQLRSATEALQTISEDLAKAAWKA